MPAVATPPMVIFWFRVSVFRPRMRDCVMGKDLFV
ncbi:hypothetical protein SFR_5870 [Streptomyces sp. FR-008]|nr:hypothetical protein SFR_5870 [Streptomyces sp. FR-008]